MNQNNNQPQPQTPQQYTPAQYYPDDEISLIDLWNTLMRRKKVLFAVFALVIIFSVIYLFLAKPVYESRALIEIGKVNGKVVEDINILKQRLLIDFSGEEEFSIGSVEVNPEGTKDSMQIAVYSKSPENAKKSLSALVDKLKEKHNLEYREAVSRLEKREQSLMNDIRGYRNQLDELELVIKNIKGTDAGHLALLMVNRGNVRDTVVAMEKELVEIQSMLSDSFATHIVGRQLTKESPIKPKRKLVMALSIVLGLMLGIFAAFFTEFIAKARNTESGTPM